MKHLTSVLGMSMLAASAVFPQRRPRTQAASVAILVGGGRATVEARYEFSGNPGAMSFEYLERPCAAVGPISLESNGQAVPYARVATGPWVRLHDTSAVNPDRTSLGYRVSYGVQLTSEDVSIPLVVPTSALPTTRRGEPVAAIYVTLPPEARVILPRMGRAGTGNRWAAHIVALPSAVRVSGAAPGAECASTTASSHGGGGRDGGGLARIFWALVVTLSLWVVLYLYWANRERRSA